MERSLKNTNLFQYKSSSSSSYSTDTWICKTRIKCAFDHHPFRNIEAGKISKLLSLFFKYISKNSRFFIKVNDTKRKFTNWSQHGWFHKLSHWKQFPFSMFQTGVSDKHLQFVYPIWPSVHLSVTRSYRSSLRSVTVSGNWKSCENHEKCFNFTLKVLFVLKIFRVLSWVFW